MFRATRALRMAVTKTSTGLVGLPVNPNARADLIGLYQRTLKEAQALPAEAAAYKDAVEHITKYRLSVCEKHSEVHGLASLANTSIGRGLTWGWPRQESAIEKEINCGQLEELIEQAHDELSIFPVYVGACRRWLLEESFLQLD